MAKGWKVNPAVTVAKGTTFTLCDIEGPGAIQQIWLTPTGTWRYSILRVYWDGAEHPSVECPVGDFFACGWGKYAPVSSLAICVNPGSAFNCYWPMPFRQRCRITLENIADEDMRLYYQINYALQDIPEEAAYFHAQFRRVNPVPYKEVYTILDGVEGWGQYVGTYMAWGSNNAGWWGEGEIKFFLDGDGEFPTICGTGTEDYFLRLVQLREQEDQAVRGVHHALRRVAAGDPARRIVPVANALRDVPLARHGPGALRARPARDHPGAGPP